jgi:glycoprotein 6-alpha-L-fucosyltransferase
VLLSESYNLSISGNLGEHRRLESSQLAASVQARLTELQNPSDCELAKKLVCDLTKGCGFGCQMHHILYCLQAAFYTNRTLILDSYGWQYNPDGIDAYFKPLSNKCTQYKGTPVNWNGTISSI